MSTGGRGRGNTLPMRLRRSMLFEKNVCYFWSFFRSLNASCAKGCIAQGWYMSDSVFYSLISILLVIAGIAIGGVLGSDLSTFDFLQKILSTFASIATIAGIIVAIKSLVAWRKQFTHQKLDKVLDELEKQIHPLVDSYVKSWFAHDRYLLGSQGKNLSTKEDLELLQERSAATRPVVFRLMDYGDCFKRLEHFVHIADSDPLSPSYIGAIHQDIYAKLEEDAKNGFPLVGGNFKDTDWDLCELAANTQDKMYESLYKIRRKYLPIKF